MRKSNPTHSKVILILSCFFFLVGCAQIPNRPVKKTTKNNIIEKSATETKYFIPGESKVKLITERFGDDYKSVNNQLQWDNPKGLKGCILRVNHTESQVVVKLAINCPNTKVKSLLPVVENFLGKKATISGAYLLNDGKGNPELCYGWSTKNWVAVLADQSSSISFSAASAKNKRNVLQALLNVLTKRSAFRKQELNGIEYQVTSIECKEKYGVEKVLSIEGLGGVVLAIKYRVKNITNETLALSPTIQLVSPDNTKTGSNKWTNVIAEGFGLNQKKLLKAQESDERIVIFATTLSDMNHHWYLNIVTEREDSIELSNHEFIISRVALRGEYFRLSR